MAKSVIVTFIFTFTLLFAGFIWLSRGPQDVPGKIAASTLAESQQILDTKQPHFSASSSPIRKSAPLVMWSLIEESNIPEIRGYQGGVVGAVPLKIKTTWSSKIALGDNILLSIPQIDVELLLVVTRVKSRVRGIKVITATGIEDSADLLLTLGPSSTFANIDTRKGTYELVGTASFGWLMPSANMDPNVNYAKPDYVVQKITDPSSL